MLTNNYKNQVKYLTWFFIPLLLIGCPSSDTCFDPLDMEVTVPDLITITPLQDTYNQGDEITVKYNLTLGEPYYFGQGIDVYGITNDNEVIIYMTDNNLFLDNNLFFLKGKQGEESNWFILPYNSETNTYELEFKVKLNRLGEYRQFAIKYATFISSLDECNRFILETNIAGEVDNYIEFEVIE